MNKQAKLKWWQILLSIIIVAGLFIAMKYILISIWKIFSGLQKEIAAALIASSATILVSVFSVTGAKYYEKKQTIEQELRQRKIPIYEDFISFLFKLIGTNKTNNKQITEEDMQRFLIEFTQKLMIWGSDEVVAQWLEYRRVMIKHSEIGQPDINDMFELEKLLIDIRKDIGHKNKNIKKGDLLGLFINDIENYLDK
jgi:hypothetical protein